MDKKKSFGVSPEDQARLEAMGTERVLADLAKKYLSVKSVGVESSSSLSPEDQARLEAMGGLAVLDQLNQKRDELIRELEQLPRRRETYQKQELSAILKVKERLRNFIGDFDRVASDLSMGSQEYRALCEQYIEQVMLYLDQEDFWDYKFTTENSGGASNDQPLEYSVDDSVYYITHSGISMRIKRSASELGLGTAVQPFYEKIVFKLPDSKLIVEKPRIGSRVIEYRSDEFRELLNCGKVSRDFESPNELYLKDGRIFFVSSNDPKPHEGDRVNKILVTR